MFIGAVGGAGGGLDADAVAYQERVVAAGGALSETEFDAINTLCLALKDGDHWSGMQEFCPFLGDTVLAAGEKLIYGLSTQQALTNSGFDASDYTRDGAASGVKGDGTNRFNTGITTKPDNGSVFWNVTEKGAGTGNYALWGTSDYQTFSYGYHYHANNHVGASWRSDAAGVANLDQASIIHFYAAIRNGNSLIIHVDGSNKIENTEPVEIHPAAGTYFPLFCRWFYDAYTGYSTDRMNVWGLTTETNEAKMTQLYSIVAAYLSAAGR